MPISRSIGLVFLGIVLGIGLTLGTYYGVREYAPELAARYLASVLGEKTSAGEQGASGTGLDTSTVKGIVQEVLNSEQAKAVLRDLMQSQSKETFEAFFKEAVKSPEFRQALAEALESFLETAEGKAFLLRIATEIMTP